MKTAFISKLAPLFDIIAQGRDLYVPAKIGDHFSYTRYDAGGQHVFEFNNIRACTPVKEFLFPLRELAATLPGPFVKPDEMKPFAVFGLKHCDLRSIEALDKVFLEKEFEDPFYIARREQMFVISADCTDPGESCFCNVLGGRPYPLGGFDLNVSQVKDGFIIEVSSQKGRDLITGHADLFALVPDSPLAERDNNRANTQRQLEHNNVELKLDASAKEILEKGHDSSIFDQQAQTCVECQACTRVCPTCHCFYLFDTGRQDYFAKMKMWDSCMRMAYAEVAGGANPRRILGDRLRHRLMHKFAYFVDRYGLEMCVGCGRCVDAEAGGVDIREILKELNREFSDKGNKVAKASK
jgi:heterodisulfide reductase subunit C